jgi:GDP-L-fucose synthase
MKLIFGGDGFIGQNIEADMKVGRKQVNLLDFQSVLNFLKLHNPSTVVNCAGIHTAFTSAEKYEHSEVLFTNLQVDMNLLHAAKMLSIPNVLLLSSTAAFSSNLLGFEMTEEHFHSGGEVDKRFFGYAQSKRIQMEFCKAIQLDSGLNYKTVVLGNIYGPNNHLEKNSTAIASIFHQIHSAIQNSEKNVEFFGNGLMRRNWTYVGDLNQIFTRLIADRNILDPIIVSSMEICDLRTITNLVAEALDFRGEINFEMDTPHNPREDKIVSNSKMMELIGDVPFTKIDKGIKETATLDLRLAI